MTADRPPADFALAVTVLAPAQPDARAGAAIPRDRRAARYIVEPGGDFRAALGPGVSERTYSPVARSLSRAQTSALWKALRQTDLLRDDHPAQVGLAPAPSPDGRGPLTYVISFTLDGDHRTLALYPGSPADGEAEEARRLVDRMAELAWLPE